MCEAGDERIVPVGTQHFDPERAQDLRREAAVTAAQLTALALRHKMPNVQTPSYGQFIAEAVVGYEQGVTA